MAQSTIDKTQTMSVSRRFQAKGIYEWTKFIS